jgi:hypothetical protein
MRTCLVLSAALVFLATQEALAQADAPKRLISSDLGGRELGFLQKANEHGALLIYLTETVKTKGTKEQVKALGELFASTLEKENARLLQLANDKGVTFPASPPDSLKKLRSRLEPLEKDVFDTRWLAELAVLARESVANFDSGTKSTDKDIKKYAESGIALAREKVAVLEKIGR